MGKRVCSVLLSLFMILSLFGCGGRNKKYIEKLNEFNVSILSSAADCEELGNLTTSVWSNAISKKTNDTTRKYVKKPNIDIRGRDENGKFVGYDGMFYDFNTALSNLFSDPETLEKVAAIEDSRTKIEELFLEIQNPPKKLNKQYEVAEALYDSYHELSKLVTSPTGSLKDFSQAFSHADSEVLKHYDKLKLLLSDDNK